MKQKTNIFIGTCLCTSLLLTGCSASEILKQTVSQIESTINGLLENTSIIQDFRDFSANLEDLGISSKAVEVLDATVYEAENIGAEYSFSTLFYPYYGMLNENEKAMYKQIYSNVLACADSFHPVVSIEKSELTNAFAAVHNDHPELFWMKYELSYGYTDTIVEIYLTYNGLENDLSVNQAKFNAAVTSLISGATGNDLSKEIYIYNALAAQCSYTTSAAYNQSAYSALVLGNSVCAGYAKAFQYAMQQLNIPCYYCTGESYGNGHAWNIICIDNSYYNVDVTWDDAGCSAYTYFLNLSDDDFASTHTRTDLSVYLPACEISIGDGKTVKTPDQLPQNPRKNLEHNGQPAEQSMMPQQNALDDFYRKERQQQQSGAMTEGQRKK